MESIHKFYTVKQMKVSAGGWRQRAFAVCHHAATGMRPFFLVVMLLLSVPGGAQTSKKMSYIAIEKLQKGDEYFSLMNYKTALDLYREVVDDVGEDTSVVCRIANTYRLMNLTTDAEDWYRRAVVANENTITPVFKLQFAQVLSINARYDEALYWFKSYYKTSATDKRAAEAINSIENISKLYYDTTFYLVYPVSLNTPGAEYSPGFYKNGLLFLSDRDNPKTGLVSRFFSVVDSSGNFGTPSRYIAGIKTDYNEGPVTFFDRYRKLIFSQNYTPDKINRRKVNDIPLQLFYGRPDSDNTWKDVQLLPFQDKRYSYSQPAVAEGGKVLYFSSNMPAGFGGTDIYMSRFDNGTWTSPQHVPSPVNTPGDEMFPYIYQDTILYFSSNGHGGLGGLDIFKINMNDTASLENLGMPMNSPNDDFGAIIDHDGLGGYLASNRPNGSGGDDIYKFKVIRITVTLKIIDANTTLPVSNADIYSLDADHSKKIGTTDQEGMCTLIIPVCKSFRMRIEKDNYESKIFTFEPLKANTTQLAVVNIENEQMPAAEEKIVLTDDHNKVIEHTENVVYKVQIMANRTPVPNALLKRKYRGSMQINQMYDDRWYKYSIGEFSSYAEAKSCVYECKVYDAFITAYLDGKKVHISVAKAATRESNIDYPVKKKR